MASIPGPVRYNQTARALHWIIAALVLLNLVTGLLGETLEELQIPAPSHLATGILILLLSLVRLGWRLTWRAPPHAADVSPLLRKVARVTHLSFYALMLVMPITGWIFVSASKYPISMYGLFLWPKLPLTKAMPIVGAATEAHEILGYGFAALAALHIGAALYYHFALKDQTLRRML
ncbi:cytochrome b [Novosphingobium sp. Chol11]|uniref:cytochrome b n=1 Tax=Novosphingobium sp. Chol11 TaxID=1385763 RepID=UPI0025F97570|nr:cytochrome b [Novosphingobium sp. Chol11]